jgi:hypothetical protein
LAARAQAGNWSCDIDPGDKEQQRMASHKDFPFGPPQSDDRAAMGNTIIVRGNTVWVTMDRKGAHRDAPHTYALPLDAPMWRHMNEEG